jgi:hypothetical protein
MASYPENDAYWDMVDNEGLFQGGRQARPFGRARDWFEDNLGNRQNIDQRSRNRLGRKLEVSGEVPSTYMRGDIGESPLTQPVTLARETGLNFDPSNPESVRQLQTRLNQAGYRDQEGQPLQVDAVFGPNTEYALRKLQSDIEYNPGEKFGFKSTPQAPSQLVTAENAVEGSQLANRAEEIYGNLGGDSFTDKASNVISSIFVDPFIGKDNRERLYTEMSENYKNQQALRDYKDEGYLPDYTQGKEGFIPDYFQGKEGFVPDYVETRAADLYNWIFGGK